MSIKSIKNKLFIDDLVIDFNKGILQILIIPSGILVLLTAHLAPGEGGRNVYCVNYHGNIK